MSHCEVCDKSETIKPAGVCPACGRNWGPSFIDGIFQGPHDEPAKARLERLLEKADDSYIGATSPDESGWVIVRDSAGKGLRYWDGAEFRMENLTALRFARKVDAERYLELMHFNNDYKARVEEHMWINAPAKGSE
jgi:hypothetical protein